MQTQQVVIDRQKARDLYRAYKKHVHYSEPIDRECMRAYQLLAQGRLVIKALASITEAGLNAEGLPKLAICRADAVSCRFRLNRDGSAVMHDDRMEPRHRERWSGPIVQSRSVITFPAGAFPANRDIWRANALVPSAPLHLRPARGVENYHILWEAEWTKIVPRDPFLLRRIGRGDLWLVVAMWDLTDVERAALSTRLSA